MTIDNEDPATPALLQLNLHITNVTLTAMKLGRRFGCAEQLGAPVASDPEVSKCPFFQAPMVCLDRQDGLAHVMGFDRVEQKIAFHLQPHHWEGCAVDHRIAFIAATEEQSLPFRLWSASCRVDLQFGERRKPFQSFLA